MDVCNRNKASFLERVFYYYARPIYDMQAEGNPITSEQYPELAERAKMKVNAEKIEKFMDFYIAKQPDDPYAVMKAVFYANYYEYIMFIFVRIFNKFVEIFNGMVFLEVIRSFEQHEGPFTVEQMYWPIFLGAFKCFLDMFQQFWWGYFDYQMVEVGHLTQASLKTILFRKNFRMSEATNKDFSSGEINSIIMGETGIVWDFVW